MHFRDRKDAGQKLAESLLEYKGKDVIVYALPRGGVVLGCEVAKVLNAPLNLVITRKIGHPGESEYAVCAVAEDEHMICNEEERTHLDEKWLAAEAAKERAEIARRKKVYLSGRTPISAKGKIALVVDDGVATGLTMELAIAELRHQSPAKIVVAIPVVPLEAAEKFTQLADELIALDAPYLYLGAIGLYYDEFPQVNDDEVVRLLAQAS